MLIRNASLLHGERVDLRIVDTCIAQLGQNLQQQADELIVDAHGGLLLPGLHDHHLHLAALAVANNSLHCGPPQVLSTEQLADTLRSAGQQGEGWLRGIGYDESVAGDLNAEQLDRWMPKRPLRIQHRSGQLWICNSAALQALDAESADSPFERANGRLTGRLFRSDDWLRQQLPGRFPDLTQVSAQLAARGITGLTDASPANDAAQAQRLAAAQSRGDLRQSLMLMGSRDLDDWPQHGDCIRGAYKIHLNENVLPDFEQLVAEIASSHTQRRAIAVHCVTRTELVFVLAAIEAAGAMPGDRIEHASITAPEQLERIAALGLCVVTQPNFIVERGDRYRREVAAEDQPWLYRAKAFLDIDVPLAAGSDAPYGLPDPWAAMQAAVTRRTLQGAVLGETEALSPEQALNLFLGSAELPAQARRIERGSVADLCLLDRDWTAARTRLDEVQVQLTVRQGRVIHAEKHDS